MVLRNEIGIQTWAVYRLKPTAMYPLLINLTKKWWIQGKSTISAKVKYRPSTNTWSRGGRSEALAFLTWAGSLLAGAGSSRTVSFENATLSSRLADEQSTSSDVSCLGTLLFVSSLSREGLTPAAFCCFSFCRRSLSSLCTLTGSLSFFSSSSISAGIVGGWSEDSLRKFSIAKGMVSSHSLVHWLTCKTKQNKTRNERILYFQHSLKKNNFLLGNKTGLENLSLELNHLWARLLRSITRHYSTSEVITLNNGGSAFLYLEYMLFSGIHLPNKSSLPKAFKVHSP